MRRLSVGVAVSVVVFEGVYLAALRQQHGTPVAWAVWVPVAGALACVVAAILGERRTWLRRMLLLGATCCLFVVMLLGLMSVGLVLAPATVFASAMARRATP